MQGWGVDRGGVLKGHGLNRHLQYAEEKASHSLFGVNGSFAIDDSKTRISPQVPTWTATQWRVKLGVGVCTHCRHGCTHVGL